MWTDLIVAIRSYARTPRFTIPALLALALGIGSTSAIFSVVNGVVLKPLPYRDPERIVVIWENNLRRNRPRNVIGSANFAEWRARSRTLEHIGMAGAARFNVMLGGQPEEILGLFASSDVFRSLGVEAAMGRTYTAREDLDGNDSVIILSHEFWRTRLNARPDVIGLELTTSGAPRTVIGVMPPEFTVIGQKADFYVPYGWTEERLRASPGRGFSHGIARLRGGVTFEQAEAEMKNIAAQLEKEFPRRNTGWSVTLVPAHEQTVDQIRPAILILAGAVAMVLLIACVNVANLLLARATVRHRELGVRAALGAGRWRLVRQLITESLMLGAIGGVTGLALAFAFHRGLRGLVADRIPVPRLDQVTLDAPVLAFTTALALGTGLLFGIVPALVASGNLSAALREGGRHAGGPRSRRALSALVVAEVALSLVLLTGAGLLIRSFLRLQEINPGFRAAGVLTARVSLPGTTYADDASRTQFFENAIGRVSAAPGVQSAAGVTFLPLAGPGIGTSFFRADQPEPPPGEAPVTDVRPITPGFFRTMGIPHLSGRDVAPSDRADSRRVAVISDSLARKYFPDENPLGRQISVSIGPPGGKPLEIVGVVGDIKMSSLDGEVRPAVYVPHTQLTLGFMTVVVRTEQDPLSLVSTVRQAVNSIDPQLPLADVMTMEEVVARTLARPRAVTALLTVFALLALVLAGVGVYGVMAYSVAQRTQEIGVRMALGATPESVFQMVLGQALRLVAGGVVVGLAAAFALTRLLETLLYETTPLDVATFSATVVVLVVVALLASYVPARRGTRVAPVDALRAE
jgi:putative ABC transport system permease protein